MGDQVWKYVQWRLSLRFKALRELHQAIEEEEIVVVSEETRLPVVPALNDVHGNTGNPQARATRHG